MPGWKKNIPACLQADQDGGRENVAARNCGDTGAGLLASWSRAHWLRAVAKVAQNPSPGVRWAAIKRCLVACVIGLNGNFFPFPPLAGRVQQVQFCLTGGGSCYGGPLLRRICPDSGSAHMLVGLCSFMWKCALAAHSLWPDSLDFVRSL